MAGPRRRHWLVVAIVLAIALVAMWTLLRAGGRKDGELTAGDEVFAMDPHSIQEVRYTTAKIGVIARREGDSDTFAIQVHTNDPPFDQSCRSGEKFRRFVDEFSSLRVKEVLLRKEGEGARSHSDGAAKLELRDNTPIDPKEFRIVMFGTPERPVFLDGHLTYVPAISAEWFRRLSGGCGALSGD